MGGVYPPEPSPLPLPVAAPAPAGLAPTLPLNCGQLLASSEAPTPPSLALCPLPGRFAPFPRMLAPGLLLPLPGTAHVSVGISLDGNLSNHWLWVQFPAWYSGAIAAGPRRHLMGWFMSPFYSRGNTGPERLSYSPQVTS